MLMVAPVESAGKSRIDPSPAFSNDTSALTDVRALVARAQAGDREAFGELYRQYFETVYRFVARRCGRAGTVAEDITTDTFVKAIQHLGRFEWQGRDLAAWLVTIARNLLADHNKSAKCRLEFPAGSSRELRHDIDATPHDFARRSTWRSIVDGDESPSHIAVDRVRRTQLLAAIGRLLPSHRAVIMLRFYLDLSIKETAAALRMNEGAVKGVQSRAVQALARELPDGGAEWR